MKWFCIVDILKLSLWVPSPPRATSLTPNTVSYFEKTGMNYYSFCFLFLFLFFFTFRPSPADFCFSNYGRIDPLCHSKAHPTSSFHVPRPSIYYQFSLSWIFFSKSSSSWHLNMVKPRKASFSQSYLFSVYRFLLSTNIRFFERVTYICSL